MRFGINFVNGGVLTEPDRLLTLGLLAEDLGFSSMWAADHVVIPVDFASRYPLADNDDPPFPHDVPFAEPIVQLTFLAAVTASLRLGIGVLVLAQRNPVAVAKQLATLDRLSGGRLLVGIGTGWLREEYEALGVPFEHRFGRTREGIEVLRHLWQGPAAGFDGKYFRFPPVTCNPRPARPGGVPIVIGGYAMATARRAGRLGDGYFPGPASVEQVREYRKEIRDAALAAGRSESDIELTVQAPYDRQLTPDLCREYEEAGVAEILITAPENDPATIGDGTVEATRKALETFKSQVMEHT